MAKQSTSVWSFQGIGEEINGFFTDVRGVISDLRPRYRTSSTQPAGGSAKDPPMLDPVRFKRILFRLLKLLILIELFNALSEGATRHEWGRFGVDLILAGILFAMWERITTTLKEKKEQYRRKMEVSSQNVGLWDSLAFSLLWSDEIYADIPADRRRLVVISYTLIALGLVAAFVKIGTGLMPLIVSGALVLAAVNLLIWVVSLERGEKETLQTELKLARDVQMSLMPKASPAVPGFDIAGMSVPALDVGGDLFDYSRLGPAGDRFGISVFDVSGKGMQAAMAAVFTCGAFASEAGKSGSPAEILTRLNKAVWSHSRKGHFVAFLLAVIDPARKTLTFANAGQTKPLLASRGEVRWLDGVGVHFPLGMKDDSCYQECTVQLSRGDRLFLLTDGFTDAMNPEKEMFGMERMEQLICRPPATSLDAARTLEYLTQEVRRHASGAPQHDDMTMVIACAF